MTKSSKRPRLRWLLRVVAALAITLLPLAALPFLFTTALVRWALQRSSYARFSPTIQAASLHPDGTFTLSGLILHESRDHDPLFIAGSITIKFGWHEVVASKVHSIDASHVTLYLRPGAGENDPAISAMQLFSAPASPTTTGPSAAVPSGVAFWYDTLRCRGSIDFGGLSQFKSSGTTAPFTFESQMHGTREAPTRGLAVSVGSAAGSHLLANATITPINSGTRITLDHLSAHDIGTVIKQSFLEVLLKNAPVTFHQDMDAHLDTLDVSASVDRLPTGLTGTVHLDLHGLNLAAAPSAKHPFQLQNLALTGDATGPLGAKFSSTGTLAKTEMTFNSITYGKNQLQQFSTPIAIAAGILQAPAIKLTFANGAFAGNVRYSLIDRKLEAADLQVQHLDQKQLAANLAPDKLNAEGTTSGTIHLASNPDGALTGTINLIADGPGRLQIKDQAAADAIAQKLQTGAAAGVLPANFSTIVVQQLKDYPYKTGHIQVDAPDGVPAITLNYARDPIKAGDPGYGIQTTIGGQKVLANYTIQLPALTIVLQGKTIAGVLSLATGFENELASEPERK